MSRPRPTKSVLVFVIGAVVLAGTMGQGCPGFGLPSAPPVIVELTNNTSQLVDPFLWADPATIDDPAILMATPPIPLGLPLNPPPPPDVITVTFDCADAGTLVADGDLLLVPSGALASSNILLMQEGFDYFCGDIVTFIYEVDDLGDFFTTVYVNDQYLAP